MPQRQKNRMAQSLPSLAGRLASAGNEFAKAGIFNFDDQEPGGAAPGGKYKE
jgi:hypothetical protein